MNIEKVFIALKNEPQLHSLIVAVLELENQGYTVIINDKYSGSKDLFELDERNELNLLPSVNGIPLEIYSAEINQKFRMHFIDDDKVCFSSVDSLPIQLNENFTTELLSN